jgi:hypothetical protein
LPDWEAVEKELRGRGVTLRLLWLEYLSRHPEGASLAVALAQQDGRGRVAIPKNLAYRWFESISLQRRVLRDHAAPTRRRSPQARRALLHRQRDRRRDGGIQPFRRCATPVIGKRGRCARLPATSEGGRNPFSACSRLSVSASALPMLRAPLWTSGPRKSGQATVARD